GGIGNNTFNGKDIKGDANDHDVADYSENKYKVIMELSKGKLKVNTFDGINTGKDTLIDIEEVRGSFGEDVLISNSVAGGPKRYLAGLAGADQLIGGAGVDIVRYDRDELSEAVTGNEFAMTDEERAAAETDGGIIANLTTISLTIDTMRYNAGTIKDVFGDIDKLGTERGKGIEGVYGSSFKDQMRGGSADNIFKGFGGDDILKGGSGDDLLSGDDGADELYGDSDDDTLIGGDGNDLMDGGSGYDWLDYHAEEADFKGGAIEALGIVADFNMGQITDTHGARDEVEDFEAIKGTSKADTIYTTMLEDDEWFAVAGMEGADTIIGTSGLDVLRYEQDAAAGGKAGIVPDLEAGTVQDGFGTTDSVSLIDVIFATGYADTLKGSAANESFAGFAGNDVIDGGGGRNTVRYDFDYDFGQGLLRNGKWGSGTGGTTGVSVNLATGIARDGLGGQDKLSKIQEVFGTRYADNMTAADTGSEFWGEGGNDILKGGAGSDILHGGSGKNVMYGGDGDDIFHVSSRYDKIIEKANQGDADEVISTVNWTLADNIENLTLAGYAKSGIGNKLENTIIGNNSANVLDGKGGADTMEGGKGNDTYIVDHEDDSVYEEEDADGEKFGIDTVMSSVSYSLVDNVEHLILTGKKAIDGTGNELDNKITGNAGRNVIEGGIGNDILDGGAGVDTLSYANSESGVTVNFYLAECSGGDAEGDTFVNFENITGSEYDDVLTGNNGKNTLIGGDGADFLDGGKGNDILTGGDGDDRFTFSGKGFGRDVITDFEQGYDLIAVSESLLKDYNKDGTTELADLAFAFKIYRGDLLFKFDSRTSILLKDHAETELTADDFVLIPL
ncbi:MAG: hypothetical protein NWR47_06830, partial [Aestuariivirgaceae bacterium]|nr:hypothetical protein [Aestuariivirgaceae bacterium]